MPNNIANRLILIGKIERVKQLREFIKGNKEIIDFNKLIPMPSELDIDDIPSNSEIMKENTKQYGYPTWYEWCIANWGTKWNAYDQFEDDLYHIWFSTAWEGVPKIIEKIAEKFPDIDIYYSFADEDVGMNTGNGYTYNGKLFMFYPRNHSIDALELYSETHPSDDNGNISLKINNT